MNNFIILWLVIILGFSAIINGQVNHDYSYAIAITTIPPRFDHIVPTLLSWINQSYQPIRICIYIPIDYQRFKAKQRQSASPLNLLQVFKNKISKNQYIESLIKQQKIKIIELSKDYGPISRFIGLIQEQIISETRNCFYPLVEQLPDYWVISDDDVNYSTNSLSKYQSMFNHFPDLQYKNSFISSNQEIQERQNIFEFHSLSQFSLDYRVYYQLHHQDKINIFPHLQGVDTYLIPHKALQLSYINKGPLYYHRLLRAINYFHNECPESFFQDDYLISFLLHLGGIEYHSIWAQDNFAQHIEGISKNNHQMHMKPDVFHKESATKACIFDHADQIYSFLYYDSYEIKR